MIKKNQFNSFGCLCCLSVYNKHSCIFYWLHQFLFHIAFGWISWRPGEKLERRIVRSSRVQMWRLDVLSDASVFGAGKLIQSRIWATSADASALPLHPASRLVRRAGAEGRGGFCGVQSRWWLLTSLGAWRVKERKEKQSNITCELSEERGADCQSHAPWKVVF